jgi:hypothetical protein
MNPGVQKFLIAFVLLSLLFPRAVQAQNLTGIWRGYFITDMGEEYRYELQLEQSKSNRISGVSYSYLDTRFYGKATLTGNFTRSSKSALVQELKTVEVKMQMGNVSCIMKCLFTYSESGKEAFLEGIYSSITENGPAKGSNCGGGKVFLRKVSTSDFYLEPFLRKPAPSVADTVTKKPLPKPQTVQKKPVTNNTTKKPVTVTPRKPATVITTPRKPQTDSVKRKPQEAIVNDKPIGKPVGQVPVNTRSRENELVKTITVTHEDISVRLYDNGEIDGDTISVYLDGKPILTNKGLSTVPITVHVKLDESSPEHTLVMVAENLGRIPPNTSLMIVQDGDDRYQVSITSTEQKNAMVRFRYQKK